MSDNEYKEQRGRLLYLLGADSTWSETFLQRDVLQLQQTDLPLQLLTLFASPQSSAAGDHSAVASISPKLARGNVSVRGTEALFPKAFLHRYCPRLRRHLHTLAATWRHRDLIERLQVLGTTAETPHIHAEFADLPGLIAAAAARRLGCSYSIGVHARDIFCLKYDPHFLFSRVQFVTACNSAAAEAVQRAYPGINRIELLHHGLDLNEWAYREKSVAANRTTVSNVLFAGRCVLKKGLIHLLHALRFACTNPAMPPLRLTVVGDGPLKADLMRAAENLQVAEHVVWKGVLSQVETRQQILAADCLVLPSIELADGDKDGIPNVIIEAMASGTPVVGTRAGGLPEVLNDDTGWIAPQADPEALCRQIVALLTSPAEADAKCRRARRLIEAEFDASRIGRRRLELFRYAAGLDEPL